MLCEAGCKWDEEKDGTDDARKKGSKCSFNLSNSKESGAESSNFCN